MLFRVSIPLIWAFSSLSSIFTTFDILKGWPPLALKYWSTEFSTWSNWILGLILMTLMHYIFAYKISYFLKKAEKTLGICIDTLLILMDFWFLKSFESPDLIKNKLSMSWYFLTFIKFFCFKMEFKLEIWNFLWQEVHKPASF